jgi:DNA repair photolyase
MSEVLVGIARLAARGSVIEEKQRVVYRELPTRSYLNRCDSPGMPFVWTINPYRGCEFGCVYCYARYTHEFMELRESLDFETRIFAKNWNAERFRTDFARVRRGQGVALGTATDPYQPAERRYRITHGMLQVIARLHDLRLYITTKSDLIRRDVDLLVEAGRHNRIQVGVTVTTLDAKLARILEPFAPRPDLRLQAVKELSAAGVRVGVQCMPVLPRINDGQRELNDLALAAAAHGASHFHAAPLFLQPCAKRVFFPFLERHFPALAENYRGRFAEDTRLRGAYPAVLRGRIAKARCLAGLDREQGPTEIPEQQLTFPFGA